MWLSLCLATATLFVMVTSRAVGSTPTNPHLISAFINATNTTYDPSPPPLQNHVSNQQDDGGWSFYHAMALCLFLFSISVRIWRCYHTEITSMLMHCSNVLHAVFTRDETPIVATTHPNTTLNATHPEDGIARPRPVFYNPGRIPLRPADQFHTLSPRQALPQRPASAHVPGPSFRTTPPRLAHTVSAFDEDMEMNTNDQDNLSTYGP